GNRTSLAAEIDSTEDFLNSYTYDALHRLIRVDQTQQSGGNTVHGKRIDFSYNALSRYAGIARFNDTDGGAGDEVATSTFTYDLLGRLTMLEYEHGGTDLFTPYEWSYDNIHRITQFVNEDGTSDYEYDKTSQLTDADQDYQSDELYSYDANGNRTMNGYQTGGNNQLENDGTYSYEYDGEGNRTSRTNDTTDEVTEYEWDHRNRLTKVTEKDEYGAMTQVVEYTYDVFNRRIGKAVDMTSPFTMTDAVIERYVYDDVTGVASLDGGNVVLDFADPDGDGSTPTALERRYLYGNAVDQILAQEDVTESTSSADRVLWPLVDHLGTVRDFAKNDGTLGEHYEYDSYGNVVSGDTSATRYLFTSREFDEDTGLQYNRARWDDAAVGRWVSEDPIGFAAGDANVYRYVSNAPVNSHDPTGLFEGPPPTSALQSTTQSIEAPLSGGCSVHTGTFVLPPTTADELGIPSLDYEFMQGDDGLPVLTLEFPKGSSYVVKPEYEWAPLTALFAYFNGAWSDARAIDERRREYAIRKALADLAADPANSDFPKTFREIQLIGADTARLEIQALAEGSVEVTIAGFGGGFLTGAGGGTFIDDMTPSEAKRYEKYWKQRHVDIRDGAGIPINTRQREYTTPGTRSIVDQKISSETGQVYPRETIYDDFGRRIGTNDLTDHGRPNVHPNPHHHPNTPFDPKQHGPVTPGLHPLTPTRS
ncbi:MAG: hypothetical protein J5I93_27795, partial [Pirellulaceae bacterium]|nr:hypothetical protein [Pirellulaceae bacterium]